MKFFRDLADVPFDANTVITLGTFDGVHIGHRRILSALTQRAREIGGRSLVLTFHPHPQAVLRKTGDTVPILTTIEERATELEKLGVDILVVIPFTLEFANTPWQQFCDLLVTGVGVKQMIVGHDHAFGKNREGNAESLREYGRQKGFDVTEVGPLVIDGEAVSSTKIRRALAAGDLEKASAFLDRPYSLEGTVVRGDGRGRQLGIPTANIEPVSAEKLIPSNGVYCVRVEIEGEAYTGMANIGVRPTFTEATIRTIEVNLFEFDRDIYTHFVKVEFIKFVRSEQKFASGSEFIEQLGRDREVCRSCESGAL